MLPAAAQYIDAHREPFLDELKQFIRIPSISTLPEHKPDIDRAAAFVAASLKAAGLENVEIIPTAGHPLVYADWLHAPGKPTVLFYGHYDVQPADPLELWVSPPFEPEVRDGNLYARGAADDKGQMYMHIKAVQTLFAVHGTLPVNVRFLIEGEEEIGGASITTYVAANPAKLEATTALVSDTALYAEGIPTLCTGLRGLIYLELEASGPARDLHSGLYGGAAPNPVFGLIELLAKAKDAQGVIRIPGVTSEVRDPDPAELESWSRLPFDESEFLANEVGSPELTGDRRFTVLERIWSRPTFEVHGIAGGFTGTGAKTVIPARATAKLSFRLVPAQSVDRVIESFRAFVAANTPAGLRMEVRVLSAAPAVVVNPGFPAIREASAAFEEVFHLPAVYIRSGGSVPVVGDFARHLAIPTVMMGFGLPDDGLHSPNEKFRLENYYTGIKTVARFLQRYGA